MRYRAVGNRCAIHIPDFKLPIPDADALILLEKIGVTVIDIDLISLARGCIGKTAYRLRAPINQAPQMVDCSSFTKWLYAQKGVWLPRLSVQQRQHGIPVTSIQKYDLVFTVSYRNYYETDPNDEVGHVGIATGEGTVIHAASKRVGVIESSLDSFLRSQPRGIRRILSANTITMQCSPEYEVETADDIRWLILRNLL